MGLYFYVVLRFYFILIIINFDVSGKDNFILLSFYVSKIFLFIFDCLNLFLEF